MQLKFTGQFAELQKFANKVRKVPSALVTVNEQLVEETIELIREGFDTSTDPYGKAWDPPMFRNGRPMEDTGGLKAGWHGKAVSAEGFTVGNAKGHAGKLQRGTGIFGPHHQRIYPLHARALRLPGGIFRRSVAGAKPRKMVPDHGLPEHWRRRYVATAQHVLTELFR